MAKKNTYLTLRASSYFFNRGSILGGASRPPPKISGLTSAMTLKFKPVVDMDKWRWFAKFQFGHLFCLYFTDQNVNLAKVTYWLIGLVNLAEICSWSLVCSFIQKQKEIYNSTDHVYNGDVFNEMSPPSSDPKYVSGISAAIYDTMKTADPNAIWLMQAWQFLSGFWKDDLIQAWLTGNWRLLIACFRLIKNCRRHILRTFRCFNN